MKSRGDGEQPFYVPVPMVVERSGNIERVYDIYSRLLKERIVFIGTPIVDAVANAVVAQLLFLDGDDNEKPIYLYLNTPSGFITEGMAIYDTMQYIKAPVHTICLGKAASMGAVLLAAGVKGKRCALPNAKIMIHQPGGEIEGQASDMKIQAEEIKKDRNRLNRILAKHTGQKVEKIEEDTDRNFWLSPEEAKVYGLIDKVFEGKVGDTDAVTGS